MALLIPQHNPFTADFLDRVPVVVLNVAVVLLSSVYCQCCNGFFSLKRGFKVTSVIGFFFATKTRAHWTLNVFILSLLCCSINGFFLLYIANWLQRNSYRFLNKSLLAFEVAVKFVLDKNLSPSFGLWSEQHRLDRLTLKNTSKTMQTLAWGTRFCLFTRILYFGRPRNFNVRDE